MLTKKQRESLRDLMRETNGLYARWLKDRTEEKWGELERALNTLSDLINEVRNGAT